ncbi:GntR family transcriptional regulator [Facklamia sp. DSM 111018]|uniref:GntR family transcriptional regulator n=1 Tax=Facklamia lactis TaxID=2749967 RepID=A0ABS0LNA5_9LACT|nr:GntR family transcriptional regulator [Facklamia lactis]MBG9979680.1 GntR family transcriptional regulator [Facklamia lactis]MBG9985640.1 GntR family transcriptional regulator [Facklamia lactis]
MKFVNNIPIYTQIVEIVKQKIVIGEYPPGFQLPSRRQLADEWKVNPNTVQKAFKEMEELGMINTLPQRPSTITEDRQLINELKSESIDLAIHSLVTTLVPMDIDIQKVLDEIQARYHEAKEERHHD